MKPWSAWFALSLLAACGAETPARCEVPITFDLQPQETVGPMMRPGDNCLRCHGPNGVAARRPFSVGGTVFPTHDATACEGVAGVTVIVTDANQKRLELLTNEVGNFYSAEPLTQPLTMAVEKAGKRVEMPGSAPIGGCALCHSWPDPVSAIGRIRAP